MEQLFDALLLAFPPASVTIFPFGTFTSHQFTLSEDGSVFLINQTPDRLALLQQVLEANPIP